MNVLDQRNAEHTRRYFIGFGQDELTRHVCLRDWHRVEQALALFKLEVSELTARGWQGVRS